MMENQFKRWKVWPICSGSYSPGGGHLKFLGCMYGWTADVWGMKQLLIWKLLAIQRHNDGEWKWAFGCLEVKWRPAAWRFHVRAERKRWKEARRFVERQSRTQS